jgi:hypothetical protein
MYPTTPYEQLVGDTVSPGDSIYAQVVDVGGGNYALQLADYSNPADSFYTVQSCASGCADASAEWIAEAPSGLFGTLPLADYQSWSLTGASVTSGYQGNITSFPDDYILMLNSSTGDILSFPSWTAGSDFITYWGNST